MSRSSGHNNVSVRWNLTGKKTERIKRSNKAAIYIERVAVQRTVKETFLQTSAEDQL